jgi:hypothetical protein
VRRAARPGRTRRRTSPRVDLHHSMGRDRRGSVDLPGEYLVLPPGAGDASGLPRLAASSQVFATGLPANGRGRVGTYGAAVLRVLPGVGPGALTGVVWRCGPYLDAHGSGRDRISADR